VAKRVRPLRLSLMCCGVTGQTALVLAQNARSHWRVRMMGNVFNAARRHKSAAESVAALENRSIFTAARDNDIRRVRFCVAHLEADAAAPNQLRVFCVCPLCGGVGHVCPSQLTCRRPIAMLCSWGALCVQVRHDPSSFRSHESQPEDVPVPGTDEV